MGTGVLRRGEHSSDFDKTMNAFFKQLAGDDDPELLSKCFVYTRESDLADAKIGRIAEDLINSIKRIDTDESTELAGIIERVKSTNRNEFVLLVGGKGSGKSTFVERFFKYKLKDELKQECIIINMNLGEIESEETVIKWLNNKLIEIIEQKVYNGAPTLDELIGMFFGEYRRLSEGNWKTLYDKDKPQFKLEFGIHLENKRENHQEEYIKNLVGDISKRRKKIPCLIFDNTDHFSISFQEKVFQYAMSIYEKELCLIILPITDKTSWQLSKQGALQSFDDIEVLHLPTPSPKRVIERRIEYLSEKIEPSSIKQNNDYFFGKGIRLTIDNLHRFVTCLQAIFLKDNLTATWIGNFSNLDIRRCLTLTRDIVSSPYLKIDELVGAYVSNSAFSIKPYRIKNSIIKHKYNFYPTGQHNFVYNIFNPNIPFATSPLIVLRILQLLYDKKGVSVEDDSYISIEQVCDYFMAMQIERHITLATISDMLKAGLCYSYDPSILEIDSIKLIELSNSGKQHYSWGIGEAEYFMAMIEVTPIKDEPMFNQLSESFNVIFKGYDVDVSKRIVKIFTEYLLAEDKWYCKVPNHEAYKGQEKLPAKLVRRIKKG